jgi:hypothetical protein
MGSEPTARGEYATIGQVPEISSPPAGVDACGTTIAEAIATFRGAIPQLFESHRGEWVAYRGGELLGFGTSKDDLFNEWLRRGVARREIFIRKIDKDSLLETDQVDASPDVF